MNNPESNHSVLEGLGVRKSYFLGGRSIEVLKGVDIQVQQGEFVALRGSSGAGKSTLLHLLGGLDIPNAGKIRFQNYFLDELSTSALASLRNRKMGFIFQAYHLLPELNALENVCLPGQMNRTKAGLLRQKGEEFLARVGLKDRMQHRPFELSGGEQQRVAIARALINNPDLILADEPTGNLDSKTGEEILNLLLELRREKNTTLVIATHDDKVAFHAPRTISLVDGMVAPP